MVVRITSEKPALLSSPIPLRARGQLEFRNVRGMNREPRDCEFRAVRPPDAFGHIPLDFDGHGS